MSTKDGRCTDPTVFEGWDRPVERTLAELHCLARTLMPSDHTRTRTAVTLLLFLIWGLVILGFEYQSAALSLKYGAGDHIRYLLTALVFLVIGRMWGIEVNGLINGLGSSSDTDRDDTND